MHCRNEQREGRKAFPFSRGVTSYLIPLQKDTEERFIQY